MTDASTAKARRRVLATVRISKGLSPSDQIGFALRRWTRKNKKELKMFRGFGSLHTFYPQTCFSKTATASESPHTSRGAIGFFIYFLAPPFWPNEYSCANRP